MKSSQLKQFAFWVALASNFCAARAETVRAPNAIQGNGYSDFPFLLQYPSNSMRYQEVFAASDFAPLHAAGGGYITQVSFRVDGAGAALTTTPLQDIQINLSITAKSPDGLSALFSDNVGLNETIVRSRGPITIPGSDSGFLFTIPFTTPFFYTGSPGNNLLLDVRNFVGGYPRFDRPSYLDAENTLGDSVSSAFAYSADATAAEFLGTEGLVAQFTYTPAPEPSAGILTVLGFLILAGRNVALKFQLAPPSRE